MIIYTDGSSHPNPGPGGFGVVVLDNNENLVYTYSKQCADTTNNREELKAILYSLLKHGVKINDWNTDVPIVYSDSNYCIQTLNDWMFKWQRNGWIKSDKKVPENLDIIQAFYNLYEIGYRIDLRKVKGHSGQKWNEMADGLATGKIQPTKEN